MICYLGLLCKNLFMETSVGEEFIITSVHVPIYMKEDVSLKRPTCTDSTKLPYERNPACTNSLKLPTL